MRSPFVRLGEDQSKRRRRFSAFENQMTNRHRNERVEPMVCSIVECRAASKRIDDWTGMNDDVANEIESMCLHWYSLRRGLIGEDQGRDKELLW